MSLMNSKRLFAECLIDDCIVKERLNCCYNEFMTFVTCLTCTITFQYAVMAANHKAHSGENESQQKKSSRTAKRPLENEREPLVDESEQPSKKVKFSVGEKVWALYKDGHSYKARIIRINKNSYRVKYIQDGVVHDVDGEGLVTYG
ncbi:uncharacterized protein LOC123524244 isoform X1 [Mercenaria mercenaria]|uniref:uncharacterized protein LOC123524244 isoform X1 n=2 Tax=Mercenaria mercenaria TaxID=6596 RepID=UPI00234EC17A|nr:uncharacterized protein LOC123524244 isoform X1 [Mercenaria mercenaria]